MGGGNSSVVLVALVRVLAAEVRERLVFGEVLVIIGNSPHLGLVKKSGPDAA